MYDNFVQGFFIFCISLILGSHFAGQVDRKRFFSLDFSEENSFLAKVHFELMPQVSVRHENSD
jgi:hypothetical protein